MMYKDDVRHSNAPRMKKNGNGRVNGVQCQDFMECLRNALKIMEERYPPMMKEDAKWQE